MAAFVFIQNIYIYDVSNKYTQHIKKFSLNTTNGAKKLRKILHISTKIVKINDFGQV